MILNKTITQHIVLGEVDRSEAFRYARADGKSANMEELLNKAEKELLPNVKSLVTYRIVPYSSNEEKCIIGEDCISSKSLKTAFSDAEYAVIMIATVGISADRLIAKHERLSLSQAFMISALANERVECLCDTFCDKLSQELSKEGYELTRRFSPGYGDLALELHKSIFSLLKPEKTIGVFLTESLMMTPTKSVSALIGIKRMEQ